MSNYYGLHGIPQLTNAVLVILLYIQNPVAK